MKTAIVTWYGILIPVVQYFCAQTGRYKATYKNMLIQLKSEQLEVLKLYDFLNILLTVWLYMLFSNFMHFAEMVVPFL